MHVLRVLSRRGDESHTWDPQLATEGDPEAQAAVREAERIFAAERARGSSAWRVQPGEPTTRVERFDPQSDHIVIVPQVIGG